MKRLAKSEPDGSSTLLRRRDFLTLGSAGLLTPLIGSLAWVAPLEAAEIPVRPMSVGYVDGSEEYRSFKRLPRVIRRPLLQKEGEEEASPVVIPAESLFQADTSLPGRPLRIHVHGLYPPAALEVEHRREVPVAVDLEAVFPSPDPAFPAPLRSYVWGLRQKYGWDPSPPTSFRFPLEWQVLPQLILRVWRADGSHHVMRTRFTLDDEPGRPKLRRGVYLLGLGTSSWRRAARLSDFARIAPAEMFSVMVSMDPEAEA
jgi:hypothetical protein